MGAGGSAVDQETVKLHACQPLICTQHLSYRGAIAAAPGTRAGRAGRA